MQQFKDRAKAHVRKIFRVRQRLLDEHKSLSQSTVLKATLERMERQLGFFPYNSDDKMAWYIYRHMFELLFLTPGKGSGSHELMMKELNDLYDESIKLIKQHEPHSKTVC